MSKNIGFKNGYALGLIKAGLNKEDKKIIDSLSAEEQIRLANLQKNNDPTLNEEVNKAIGKDNAFFNRQDKMAEIREKGIEKQGIDNPTKVTSNAFYQQIKANSFDDIYNLIGIGTHLSQKEQAKFMHYKDMKTTSYVQIAQNDKIIKQNDEIIDLLKQIANKGEM
ncbi:hypothetical protein LZT66_07595 [Staphylococcus epidermidis]|uniref:hypothetical protein n=1 Tax=Staphylococcus epidermidis TaxID=1282 RepID=UPI00209457FB|nr:hypothetical protein [Staphylococcus epidermidis]MCO6199920.1 hypothetical protein [Staphylococcus epidermidis]